MFKIVMLSWINQPHHHFFWTHQRTTANQYSKMDTLATSFLLMFSFFVFLWLTFILGTILSIGHLLFRSYLGTKLVKMYRKHVFEDIMCLSSMFVGIACLPLCSRLLPKKEAYFWHHYQHRYFIKERIKSVYVVVEKRIIF